MPAKSNKSATQTDKGIGQKIRVARLAKGWTQTELGETLGVTFQQIQKYEKGGNRVGSGRLFQIAELLEVPLMSFFSDEKPSRKTPTPGPFGLLDDPLTLQMLKEFTKVSHLETRRALLSVVERMAEGAKRSKA